MRSLYVVGAIGLLLSIATAFLYLSFAGTSSQSATVFVAGETFKALLTFTLVALGGALIKRAIDASLDEQRAHRSLAEQSKERQTSIIKEFVEVFSQFYSVRKLYESARRHPQMYDQRSKEYALLIKDLLKKSVDLEGRYGALKILAINHFGLLGGNLSTKNINELEKCLEDEASSFDQARYRLDLLGELYDDWRHALRDGQEIKMGDKVWENYEALLKFLVETEPPERKRTTT